MLLKLQEHNNERNDKKLRHEFVTNALQSHVLGLMQLLQDNDEN